MSTIVVIGGTAGIGKAIAAKAAARGDEVVITGRDPERTAGVAKEIGGNVTAIALDLAEPTTIAEALAGVSTVDHLVIAAIERDQNTAVDYDVAKALRLVTLKLVGYTEVVHALLPRMGPSASVVLFGGLAKERPYPGSTTVTTVNGGVSGLVRTLAVELAPIRVNGVHPGIIGDTPTWEGKSLDHVVVRTPLRRLATTDEVVDAVEFLLRNGAVNGVELAVDGGWLLT
ncbi:short-chain dehydrogenase [Virgisporangium aliadipatigenens]|uniref:Short-chain dehydrogenase n=1 Tax=Virgisporangium aliadipatigenens TaxID=741659 RepID=A0A8J4DTH3_9ACTN|nr:SDR family oxidoreductase [Virgisporangium aliadipatigenens]GIJ48237.1 short-chain dehydrogenase [Virgisporangium aliadipatigenens]